MTVTRIARSAAVTAALALGASQLALATPIFVDNFDNGSVSDSDHIPGFWHTAHTGQSYAVVADGKLTMHAETDSESTQRRAIIYSDIREEFNFFSNPLQLQVSGLTFTGDSTVDRMKLGLTNRTDITLWGTDSSIYLELRSTGTYYFFGKVGQGSANGPTLAQGSTSGEQSVTGFTITLDEVNFELSVQLSDGSTHSHSGEHNLNIAAWGNEGASSLRYEVEQREPAGSATSTTEQILVVPEPASLGLLGLGGLLGLRRARDR